MSEIHKSFSPTNYHFAWYGVSYASKISKSPFLETRDRPESSSSPICSDIRFHFGTESKIDLRYQDVFVSIVFSTSPRPTVKPLSTTSYGTLPWTFILRFLISKSKSTSAFVSSTIL